MTFLSFDTLGFSNIADAFFNNTRVLYIAANMPAYKLCGIINEVLDFNFNRRCDLDIKIELPIETNPGIDLFGELLQEEVMEQYFPIYHYAVPHSTIEFFIIGNQSGTKYLIPEMKHASFFLLVKHHKNLTYDEQLTNIFSQIPGIDIIVDIPIDEFIYKDALIFE